MHVKVGPRAGIASSMETFIFLACSPSCSRPCCRRSMRSARECPPAWELEIWRVMHRVGLTRGGRGEEPRSLALALRRCTLCPSVDACRMARFELARRARELLPERLRTSRSWSGGEPARVDRHDRAGVPCSSSPRTTRSRPGCARGSSKCLRRSRALYRVGVNRAPGQSRGGQEIALAERSCAPARDRRLPRVAGIGSNTAYRSFCPNAALVERLTR